MHVRCPHCHNPVEILDDSSLREIPCSSCGSSFSLVADNTISFKTQETKRLGRFEVIEKLGVGSFGTVWKARDTELDRTVAIKIPRNEQLSEEDTEQFFREARAAAQLKHPSIVGVHEVGRDKDTVFIVSDFVQGLTLSDWLTGQRPSIRTAVELIVKVSDALHAAHEKGVVHRDLKPSNIMLDEKNEPHVMDFGLAKREAGEITMTVDGQVLGTPAYMAPEQARGDAHKADRRSDVYALGVILFELLTGEKPFRGNTRMLLHQVLNEEAPSPRKLNSTVPPDLETITLRCLEKAPERRFQTAAEFSAELTRFLSDEPVLSRPIGKVERGLRWCKRKPVVASLASCIALLLIVGISIVSVLWVRAENNAQQAREFAGRFQAEATKATNLATRERKARLDAESEKVRADANFDRAQSVVEEFFTEVSESRELLRGTPGTQELRRELLTKAEKYYEEFLAENDSPELAAELALARYRLGAIQHVMGRLEEAEQSFLRSLSAYQGLAEKNPTVLDYQSGLSGNYINLAVVYQDTGKPEQAVQQHELAIEIQKRIVEEDPTVPKYQSQLAASYGTLGEIYTVAGKLEEAVQQYELACEILKLLVEEDPTVAQQSVLAVSYGNLGNIYRATGKQEEAVQQYENAIEIAKRLVEENPTVAQCQSVLAVSYTNFGRIYSATGKPEEAVRQHELAIEILKRLVDENPTVSQYQRRLAVNYRGLGIIYSAMGKPEEAVRLDELAIEILKRLVDKNPTVPAYQSQLAMSYGNLGAVYQATGKPEEAVQQFEKAIEIEKRLVDENPTVPVYQNALAVSYTRLGLVYKATGKPEEAVQQYEKAIEIEKRLVDENATVAAYQCQLAVSYTNLGTIYRATGKQEEAVQQYEKAIEIAKLLVEEDPTVAQYQSELAVSYANLGAVYLDTDKPEEAVRQHELAIEILKRLVDENPTIASYQTELGQSCAMLARVRWAQGKHADALELLATAKLHFDSVLETNPGDSETKQLLASANMMEQLILFTRAMRLATSPDDTIRNGEQALADATRLCELTEWKNYWYLAALAAAYAQVGDFEKAVEYQQKAMDLAPDSAKADFEEILALYRERKPRRQVKND